MKCILSLLIVVAMLFGCERSSQKPEADQIVFKDAAGNAVKISDLRVTDGEYQWKFTGGKSIPSKAQEFHQKARQFGGSGDYAKAVELLKEASSLAPDWPYPIYDLAYTRLLMGEDDEALKLYEKVDQIAPRGFFTAKTGRWALSLEKDGTFPRGTYLSYLKIEWAETIAEKIRLAREILQRSPDYAPALKELSYHLDEPEEKMRLIEKAVAAKPDAETYGILMVNKAAHLNGQGKRDEAIAVLGELVLSTNSTLSTVALAKTTLSRIIPTK